MVNDLTTAIEATLKEKQIVLNIPGHLLAELVIDFLIAVSKCQTKTLQYLDEVLQSFPFRD